MAKDPQSESSNNHPRNAGIVRRVLVAIALVLSGITVAAFVASFLFVSLIHVDGVHRYLLDLAQQKASSMLGVPVTLENFSVDIPALRADLYGLTIDGKMPYRTPPLLQVNHVAVSARIVSIFHRKWYLDRVEVDRPVVWIIQGNRGQSNLPLSSNTSGSSNIDLFNLAIRHVELNRGEIYIDDRPQSLSARMVDLDMGVRYSPLAKSYSGRLDYADGQIQFGAIQPVSHAIDALFTYTPGRFLLKRAILRSGRSRIELSGDITHFSQPEARATYDVTIDGGEIRRIVRQQSLPSGLIETKGTVTYIRDPAKPLLASLTVIGSASSKALTISMQRRSFSVRNLFASYSAAGGEVKIREFKANALGGTIALEASERMIGKHQGGFGKAQLYGLSLDSAQRLFQVASPDPVALSGRLDGSTSATWGPRFENLGVTVDAFTKGQMIVEAQGRRENQRAGKAIASQRSPTNPGIPLQVEIHALYTTKNKRLELQHTLFQTQGTSITLNGTVSAASNLAVNFKSNELGSLATLSSMFVKQPLAERLRSMALSGEASLHGTVTGSIASPQMSGYVEAANVSVSGSQWKSLHANFGISPSLIRVENAHLAPASQGGIQFGARMNLTRWSFTNDSPVEATVTMSRIKTSDLMQMTGRTFPVSGILNAELRFRGSVDRPGGSGRIKLSNANAYQQPVKSAVCTFSASGGEVRGNSIVEIAGGTVTASASVNPSNRTYGATINSRGIQLERLQLASLKNAGVAGTLRIKADGSGSFDNPKVNAEIQIPNASVERHSLPGINLALNLNNRVVSANLSSSLARAPVEGHARISLAGDYPTDLSLDTSILPLQPILALYAPDVAEQLTGQTQVHLQLHGPIRDRKAVAGEVTIPLLKLNYKNVAAVEATLIRIDYRDGVLRLAPTTIHGTDANLQLEGTLPIFSKLPISLNASGSVNLELAQALYPGLRASGTARIDIRSGTASPSQMNGQINIVNANLASPDFPTGLQNANGVLSLSGNRIDITSFDGTVGGGQVTAQGGVSFRPRLEFDLGMAAKNVRMLYPQGVRESLNANLRLTGSYERALLGGSVGITDVSFTPGFDLISMAGQFSSGVSTPTTPGFSQNLALNIAVQSTNTLSPSSRTTSVSGTAALSVRGTAAHPSLIGRVNLTGGSMIFHGDRFVVKNGIVQFVNPSEIQPVLNVSLQTTIQQYEITLQFKGPANQMNFEYTSNPSLPRADIISLLAFGATTEARAQNATPANQAAESLVASQVSSQVTSRISKIAGISQLSISPVLTSGTAAGPPGAVITIRQQVTGNLFITFSTNVASAQDQTIQGQYMLSPRVSVSATRDPNGGSAVDVLIKKSW